MYMYISSIKCHTQMLKKSSQSDNYQMFHSSLGLFHIYAVSNSELKRSYRIDAPRNQTLI